MIPLCPGLLRVGLGPLARADQPKIFKSEWLTVSCRETWAWFERVNLYNLQIMILLRSTKLYVPWLGPTYLYLLSPFSPPCWHCLYLITLRSTFNHLSAVVTICTIYFNIKWSVFCTHSVTVFCIPLKKW
jgi:hypothetical protein